MATESFKTPLVPEGVIDQEPAPQFASSHAVI
jgi:hypothetical protein